jgi:subtilase family serine protease
VTVNPVPTAVASGSATIAPGQSTPLTGSGGVSCSWSPATGLDDPASCTPIASPAVTTTYTLAVTSAEGCVSNNAPTVTVTVVPPKRTLTITKTGVGTGRVTSQPVGIDCGTTCSGRFDDGTAVTLIATPDPSFAFGGWTGDADCTDGLVTMNADKTCTAAFNRRPDLKVQAVTAPGVALAGDTIVVADTTANVSATGGPAFPGGMTRLYLSADNVLDPADTPLGARAVMPLGPGASDSGSTNVTIPAIAVGVYWIIAKADADDQVPETNEVNNTHVSKIKVGADLRVSALSGLPAKAGPGDTISATDTTANAAGAAGAGASATGFYLSADAILDAGDTFLASRPVAPLAPGATDTVTTPTPLTLPTGISPGTWYVIAKADFDGRFVELDETDNARSKAIQIGPPDLFESALQAPLSAAAGASIDLNDTVKNGGVGGAGASTTRFYLSSDSTLDAGDTPLGTRSVPALGPGQTSGGITTVVIPAGTARGSYFLIAAADAGGAVSELDETNNARSRAFTVR